VGSPLRDLFPDRPYFPYPLISTYNGVTGNAEDPEYDAMARIQVDDYINPTAKFGLVAEPIPGLRIGGSVALPVTMSHEAKVTVQLPASPLYANSRVEGQRADFELKLPMVVRGAVEVAPRPNMRLEVGVTWERWSVLDAIRVEPIDIVMYDIPSIDRYQVPALEVGVGFGDTTALNLGGEYDLGDLLPVPVTLRGGYMFERGAAEDKNVSVLAWDSTKHVVSLGASVTALGFRVDLVYAHVFLASRDVPLGTSQAMQVNPIRPDLAVSVGAGRYEGSVDILGLGVTRGF
jgi:long-subunit fatty acid transport protein